MQLGLARSDLAVVAQAISRLARRRSGAHQRPQRLDPPHPRDPGVSPASRTDGPLSARAHSLGELGQGMYEQLKTPSSTRPPTP
ncbi:MAG: hypothetical protein R3E42_13050 [Burkholderiaceae bacterium]